MTFLRMSTHKETPTDQISRKAFGEIIYDNFLFDIPKIFDLCCLYGNSNKPLLGKMVANVFNCQPKLVDVIVYGVCMCMHVFTTVCV